MKETFTDQLGRKVKIPILPQRIISLVPSQTELLFDLGLEERIVGVTKFCIHPFEQCKSKVIVGGTKNVNINKVLELKPDLIIANKEENSKKDIDALQTNFPTWISDISSLDDAYSMINEVGKLTGTSTPATNLLQDIKNKFKKLIPAPPLKVLYLIWKNPFMAAGQGTFINELLQVGGFTNTVNVERYPEVNSIETDVVMLSSEPYPFKEKHITEVQKKFPKAKIMVVDGEMFSWYGSRLKYFPDYFNSTFTELRSFQKPG